MVDSIKLHVSLVLDWWWRLHCQARWRYITQDDGLDQQDFELTILGKKWIICKNILSQFFHGLLLEK